MHGAAKDRYFLKPQVTIEPLVNQWYAIPHVVAPATSAMLLAFKYLPILKSFVQFPQAHVTGVKSPSLAGGSFADLDPARVPDVKALIEKTERECAEVLRFAQAIRELDALLTREANGESLEPLYARVPEPLRGYVELRYDLHHRPSIRFIEGLLYKGPYYREAAQSLALSFSPEVRPFAQSTPRLAGADRLMLQRPFRHEGCRALLRTRNLPGSPGSLAEQLGLGEGGAAILEPFLTTDEPPRPPRYEGEGVRVRYFGHSALLIESRGVCLLTDPALSGAVEGGSPRYTFADLPERIDFVLISHAHPDHVWLEWLLQLRHKLGTIIVPKNNGGGLADPSLKLQLQTLGFGVYEIEEMETLPVEGGSITGLPALGEHGDLDIRSKGSYAIRLEGRSMMVMGDSNVLEQNVYQHVRECVGKLDALFIGMEATGAPMSWGYGALFPAPPPRKLDQSRRLNSVDSVRAIPLLERFQPGRVCIYSMGREPWTSHLMGIHQSDDAPHVTSSTRLVEHCRQKGIPVDRPFGQLELFL